MEHGRAQGAQTGYVRRRFDRKTGGRWPGGWWIATEVDVEYATHDLYRHDVVGWRRDRVPECPTGRPVRIRPDWVCEILSPSNEKRDLVDKMRTLHSSSVPRQLPVAMIACPHMGGRAYGSRLAKTAATKQKPPLLSGGNPQIAKADGDAPVQAYIAAMPGWKFSVGRRLDELIVRSEPSVRKAVRWYSPFCGIEGQGWFLSFHCFTRYIKVTFLNGASLRPLPPGESKHQDVRYLDIHEDAPLDEQLVSWVKQASKLPGDPLF